MTAAGPPGTCQRSATGFVDTGNQIGTVFKHDVVEKIAHAFFGFSAAHDAFNRVKLEVIVGWTECQQRLVRHPDKPYAFAAKHRIDIHAHVGTEPRSKHEAVVDPNER